jgi:ADP-ribosyl-[dinitrogen reductase] hydrolase
MTNPENGKTKVPILEDLFQGCLLGFAIGDALASPLEYTDRDVINQIVDMEANYLYNLPPGYWTEKTSEMLCVTNSLVETHEFVFDNFLSKYHQFIVDGYLLPTGMKYEATNYLKMTAFKLGQYLKYKKSFPSCINPDDVYQLDCEPMYRIAPIVVKYYTQPQLCLQHIDTIVNLTHSSVIVRDLCKYYGSLMLGAIMGVKKEILLSERFNIMDVTTYGNLRYNQFTQNYLSNCTDTTFTLVNQEFRCKSTKENKFLRTLFPSVHLLRKGSYKHKRREQIISDDNIFNCVEAALWAFYTTSTFEQGCIQAINLGLNSCAIGAIYGQLAGLYYGFTQIPQRWLAKLYKSQDLLELTDKLIKL